MGYNSVTGKKRVDTMNPLSNELVILRNNSVTRDSYLRAIWKIQSDKAKPMMHHFTVARIMNAKIISHKE